MVRAPIALGLITALLGCSEEGIPLPELSWEGEHVRFGSEKPLETICSGTLPYVDAYVGTLREVLGVSSDEKIRYYYLEEQLHLYEGGCDTEVALGCERDGRVLSRFVPHEHELVHAVFEPGDPAHPFIGEGIAVLWGDEEERRLRLDLAPVEVAKRLSNNERRGDDYPLVGHFMAYLLEEFGIEVVQEVARRTLWPNWKYEQLQQAFRDVVGQDFESIAQDYQESFPKCEWDDFHDPIHACREADFEVCGESSSVLIEAALECGSDTVIGVEDGEMWAEFAVDFGKSTSYTFSMKESDDVEDSRVVIRPCEGSCGSEMYGAMPISGEWETTFPLDHPAGRYVVRFVRPADRPATMSLEIRGYDCD